MDAHKIKYLLTSCYQLIKALVVLLVGSITSIIAFLVNADTSFVEPEDDVSDNLKGGSLNYRTDKLDDGTDPYGWYDN